MAGFKEELKSTLELSSMKGIPRIMRASNKTLKVIWTCSILVFFAVCMYHVCTVLGDYFEYPKVVSITPKLIDFLNPSETIPFPSIVVCNVNPFTSNLSVFEATGFMLPKDYYKKVLEVTKCNNCSAGEHKRMQIHRTTLVNTRGYYQYVGKETMRKVSHKNLIVRCMAIIAQSSSYIPMPCDEHTHNFTFVHPEFGLCYSYNTKSSPGNIVLGYSFLINLDSSFDNPNTEFDPLYLATPGLGAMIYTHDPNSVPHWVGFSALTGPGQVSLNLLSATKVERLSTPYSERECVDVEEADKVVYEGKSFSYDSLHCYGKCASQYVVDHCNCIDIFVLQSPEIDPPKYEYCASLNLPKEQLLKNMDCALSVRNPGADFCHEKCKPACKEVKYSLKSSAMKWPLPSQTGMFYENVIKGSMFETKFAHYEDIYKSMAEGHKNVSEIEKILALKAIENNFAMAYVYVQDQYYSHVKDEVKMKIGSLISLLGGALNLWSGITVLVFVEALDFFIRFSNCRRTS